MPELTADRIITACNRMRQDLWPLWQRERALVGFYNSGPLPTDCNEACDDDAPISLGVGYRYIKKPLESLLDVILNKPGFMKADACYPLKTDRKGLIQSAADKEINAIVHDRMESTIRSISGRALITGRGFLFRLSRWDWRFRTGRLLCPIDAIDDVNDESFREWAFSGQLSLRTLDSMIDASSRYSGNGGWRNSSLLALKNYILDTTVSEKDAGAENAAGRQTYIASLMTKPFGDTLCNNPLEVYWYFRKNGTKDDDGQEKIDLYCVSRWHMGASIAQSQGADGVTYKALSQTGEVEKQQIIFKLENAFESIDECLIPMILDARIDGEQEMAQVDGVGRIMIPRLQAMEHITTAILEGIAFGVQPNWTSSAAGAVPPEILRALQRNGLGPWDFVPFGLTTMKKENSMQGLGQGMQFLQMLGMSSEADAQTGEMAPQGQSQAKFKAEALMLLQQLGTGLQRRSEKAMVCYDKLALQIGDTFNRAITLWKKGDPGYHDVMRYQRNMMVLHKVIPPEYSTERMRYTCRRLAGGADKQSAIQAGTQMMQVYGGMMSPAGARFIAKEVARAQYDDPTADFLYPEQVDVPRNQQQSAKDQNAEALIDLQLPKRQDGDNPMDHLPIHAAALQKRLVLAQQAGSITMVEREGLSMLLTHMTLDAQGLPVPMQAKVGEALQAAAVAIQKLQVSGAQTEMGLKERGQQLKEAQFGFSQQREQNLVDDRMRKHELKRDQLMIQIRQILDDEKTSSVDRASTLMDMMMLNQTAGLPETATAPQHA